MHRQFLKSLFTSTILPDHVLLNMAGDFELTALPIIFDSFLMEDTFFIIMNSHLSNGKHIQSSCKTSSSRNEVQETVYNLRNRS